MLLLFTFSDSKELDVIENRSLMSKPPLDISHLDAFPLQYDKYVNDQFPFRRQIIGRYNQFMINFFHKSPVPDKVVIGKNGWLFLSGKNLDTYLGNNLFSEKELITIGNELEYRANYCKKRGIKFYFIIVPQKHTIYSEYFTDLYKNTVNLTLRTQVKQYLAENTDINCIDFTEELIDMKEQGLLYYKTGNHWNNLGAFFASRQIVNTVRKDFPLLPELNLEDYQLSYETVNGTNLAEMISSASNFKDEKITLTPLFSSEAQRGEKSGYEPSEGFQYPDSYEQVTINPGAVPLKVLMIRESFAKAQIQFLQTPFNKVVYIWDGWQYKRNEDIIEIENPDILILQVYEPFLRNLLRGLEID